MTTVVAVGRRYLPRGWSDLGRQLAIWLGFALVYQIVRGLVDVQIKELNDRYLACGISLASVW